MIVTVTDRSLVAEARRRAAQMAAGLGLGETESGRVALIATELATNLIKHAGGGALSIEPFADADGSGVELLALDKGPGIVDLNAAMTDGHSTSGTRGTGLGAIKRNADVFAVSTRSGRGTVVLARVASGNDHGPAAQAGYVMSQLCTPYPGEMVCGDGWATRAVGTRLVVLLADGSGHGPLAHAAAARAKEVFAESNGPVEQTADRIHRALGATRGAAIAIAEIDAEPASGAGRVNFVGIGNISAALIEGGQTRRMVSHNGTAGHVAPRIHVFQYPFQQTPTVVLHSDGLSARWDLSEYPGLLTSHPSLIAAVLHRDYGRGRDDASVVAVRRNPRWRPGS